MLVEGSGVCTGRPSRLTTPVLQKRSGQSVVGRRSCAELESAVCRHRGVHAVTEHALCYYLAMARPRTHDLGLVLDTVERLAVAEGAAAVTIRALSQATGVSNGALYHAFGSRTELLGQAWLRAAEKFLAMQRSAVRSAVSSGEDTPTEALVAAAVCPADFLEHNPSSARFLLTVTRDELLGTGEIADDLAARLRALDEELTALFIDLSARLWGRSDRAAVALVRLCLVELPTALILRNRHPDAAARARLAQAVRAVITIPPVAP